MFGAIFSIMSQVFGVGGATPHPGNDILLESGDFLLLEDGSSTIQLEA